MFTAADIDPTATNSPKFRLIAVQCVRAPPPPSLRADCLVFFLPHTRLPQKNKKRARGVILARAAPARRGRFSAALRGANGSRGYSCDRWVRYDSPAVDLDQAAPRDRWFTIWLSANVDNVRCFSFFPFIQNRTI